MRRFFKIAIPVFLLGFITGNAFWYLASPLWIDKVVSEVAPSVTSNTPVKIGSFVDADRTHKGRGTAQILQTANGLVVRFTEFEVTNGPDLEVWLVEATDPKSSADVKASKWVSLGQLKGNIGDQTYAIPNDVEIENYGSVVIWCEQFGVLFSPAALSEPTA
jgi:hypothetical protein